MLGCGEARCAPALPARGERRVGDLLKRHHVGLATRQCRGLLCQARRAAGDIPGDHPQRGTRARTHRRSLRGARLRSSRGDVRRAVRNRRRVEIERAQHTQSQGRLLPGCGRPTVHSLSAFVVQPSSLDGGRGHLGQVDEDGLVVAGEGSVLLVEQLDGAELAAVEGRQRCGKPSLDGSAGPRRSRIAAVPGVVRRPASPTPRYVRMHR